MELAGHPTTGRLPMTARTRHALATAGALGVALVLALAVVEPNLAFREGAAFCGIYAIGRWCDGFRFRRSDHLVVALGIWTSVSVLWSADRALSINSAMNMIACTAIYLAVRCVASRERHARWVCAGLVTGGVVAIGLIYATHGLRIRLLPGTNMEAWGYAGVNVNYTGYALATTVVAVVAWSSLATRKTVGQLLVFTGLLLTTYVGILVTGARAAVLSVACVALWWLLWRLAARRWARWSYRALVVACSSAALALTFGLLDDAIRSVLTPGDKETGDLNGRLTLWPMARDFWADSPLFGHGAGTLPHLSDGKILRLVGEKLEPQRGINAHNAILDLGVGLGVLGVLLFAAAVLIPLRPGPKTFFRSSPFLSGVFLVASLPILLFGFWIESPVFWGTLGLVVSVGSIVTNRHAPVATEPPAVPRTT